MIEETNVKPKIGNLIFVHQIKEAKGDFSIPGLYFHIKNPEDYLKHNITQSTHGPKELEEIDWQDVTKVNILPRFLAKELPEIAQKGFEVSTRIRLE